jgi:hypothetical protein
MSAAPKFVTLKRVLWCLLAEAAMDFDIHVSMEIYSGLFCITGSGRYSSCIYKSYLLLCMV